MNATMPLHSSPAEDLATKVDALLAMRDELSTAAARNLVTHVDTVGTGPARVPVTVNSSEPDNTWVVSPHTAYVRYAAEEARRFGHPLLAQPLAGLCRALGRHLWTARIDDTVAVNNWLLSTNLYPDFVPGAVRGWIDECAARWRGHAVWFRSLNARYTPEWLRELETAGCVLVPSRQVYLYDRIDPHVRRPRDLRRDFDLLETTPLVASGAADWSTADFARVADLYALLYLGKYSRLNPDYTAGFIERWHRAGLLELGGLRDSAGQLVAVVGTFSLGSTMTAPIVGYDTSLPQDLGLFRLITATVFARAARDGRRVNLSAGAAHFKRSRGGLPEIEYSAVFTRHLPARHRRAVEQLAFLARRVGVPIMRRFEL